MHKLEGHWQKKLVNIVLMEGRNFMYQATKIKQLDEMFNFQVIAVDTNGLGVGLVEKLMEQNYDA